MDILFYALQLLSMVVLGAVAVWTFITAFTIPSIKAQRGQAFEFDFLSVLGFSIVVGLIVFLFRLYGW